MHSLIFVIKLKIMKTLFISFALLLTQSFTYSQVGNSIIYGKSSCFEGDCKKGVGKRKFTYERWQNYHELYVGTFTKGLLNGPGQFEIYKNDKLYLEIKGYWNNGIVSSDSLVTISSGSFYFKGKIKPYFFLNQFEVEGNFDFSPSYYSLSEYSGVATINAQMGTVRNLNGEIHFINGSILTGTYIDSRFKGNIKFPCSGATSTKVDFPDYETFKTKFWCTENIAPDVTLSGNFYVNRGCYKQGIYRKRDTKTNTETEVYFLDNVEVTSTSEIEKVKAMEKERLDKQYQEAKAKYGFKTGEDIQAELKAKREANKSKVEESNIYCVTHVLEKTTTSIGTVSVTNAFLLVQVEDLTNSSSLERITQEADKTMRSSIDMNGFKTTKVYADKHTCSESRKIIKTNLNPLSTADIRTEFTSIR